MELRNQNYERDLGMGEMMPFEEKVLSSGLCDFALPANFIGFEEKRKIMYDCSGYTSIRDIKFQGFIDVLEVLEKTMANLAKAHEFLIDPAKIRLDGDTVYHNLKKRDVKFAYIPTNKQNLMENIASFFDYISSRLPETDANKLQEMKKQMIYRNMKPHDMAVYIAAKRREIKNGAV